ncbi:serine hydrolase domain-containing protein [Nocardia sp. NPDC050712]|uniref:serine hydrolase domain-containing protein n=1 Tax=Nocardia sp. NPDC050712 TaxID=3155518 RepID=UPI0033C8E8F0
MRIRTLVLPICTAAVLLSSCATDTPPAAAAPVAAERLRADLDALVGSGAVGALATLTEGGATSVVTAGHADIATGAKIPTDPPQYVRVGSITKTFTAALVLQLVAEHRIELDQPVEKYLPGLLTTADGPTVTVRQLLGHRSGLPEPAAAPEVDEYESALAGRTYTPAQELALIMRLPAQFAPGSQFRYANSNYIVAGMLIEAVTGHRYTDELRGRILTPLELSHTYLPGTGETGLRDPHPAGYDTLDSGPADRTRIEPSIPWASGALVSTGADLNRFYTALLAGQVVPQALLTQMLDGVDMGNGDGMSYGLGIGYAQLPCGTRYVGNVGGVRGFTAITGVAEGSGRAVTVSFTGTPTALDIGGLLTHALCG